MPISKVGRALSKKKVRIYLVQLLDVVRCSYYRENFLPRRYAVNSTYKSTNSLHCSQVNLPLISRGT